jgi:hypothetical protein
MSVLSTETLQSIVERLRGGTTTLMAANKELGVTQGALRKALRTLIGVDEYAKLMGKKPTALFIDDAMVAWSAMIKREDLVTTKRLSLKFSDSEWTWLCVLAVLSIPKTTTSPDLKAVLRLCERGGKRSKRVQELPGDVYQITVSWIELTILGFIFERASPSDPNDKEAFDRLKQKLDEGWKLLSTAEAEASRPN